jgi:hypothetical protein
MDHTVTYPMISHIETIDPVLQVIQLLSKSQKLTSDSCSVHRTGLNKLLESGLLLAYRGVRIMGGHYGHMEYTTLIVLIIILEW